jgi:hypothetical protein
LSRTIIALVALAIAAPALAAEITGPARVIDGDTLDLAGTRIRLWGIDAPETRQTCEVGTGRLTNAGGPRAPGGLSKFRNGPSNPLIDFDLFSSELRWAAMRRAISISRYSIPERGRRAAHSLTMRFKIEDASPPPYGFRRLSISAAASPDG